MMVFRSNDFYADPNTRTIHAIRTTSSLLFREFEHSRAWVPPPRGQDCVQQWLLSANPWLDAEAFRHCMHALNDAARRQSRLHYHDVFALNDAPETDIDTVQDLLRAALLDCERQARPVSPATAGRFCVSGGQLKKP